MGDIQKRTRGYILPPRSYELKWSSRSSQAKHEKRASSRHDNHLSSIDGK